MIQDEINLLLNTGTFEAKRNYLAALHERLQNVKPFVLKLIQAGENPFSSKQLDEELKRVSDVVQNIPPGTADIRSIATERVKPAKFDPETLPDVLKVTYREILSLYAQNRKNRGALQHIYYDTGGNLRTRITKANESDANRIAIEIVTNDKIISNLYQDIDYYLENGKLRGQQEEQSEIEKLRTWLKDYLLLMNYVRKCDVFFRKNQRYQNPIKYQEAVKTLNEINEYLKTV